MTSYVALLRGINVGGRNPVGMPALVECFEESGYLNVRTHLQSGNVLFDTDLTDGLELEARLDGLLSERFGISIPTVVRSKDDLAGTVANAPDGHDSEELRSEVFFLKRPLTVEAAMQQMPELREGVDSITPGADVLYFSRVAAQARKTRITRFMSLPVFRQMTVRSWRTTTRLLELSTTPG
ncbi:uncharacterized protein (DUF1697 family) [Kribbella amoyensis]|uniref:Uncharacterized protein (DUF1697 family) n=1 Tax=Kribbella amoyensis TaxID=996641 RepID=A0A561BW96_9ACTN|nr:DUF1697 domain-containing protein [Kribbella amoyensis]TWD83117.1 uncharacterized protein (DUF1697 family) [Kribbella amoyensis]